MLPLVIAVAAASGPVNGDFEADLVPWSVVVGAGASVERVEEGTDFGDHSDTSTIPFPSGTGAMLLRGGPATDVTPASASSELFVVTRHALDWAHRAEAASVSAELRVFEDGALIELQAFGPRTTGGFASESLDLQALCGAEVSVQFVSWATTVGFTHFTAIDDVQAGGPLCADYDDLDGDGFCVHGVDLDLDGRCDAVDEAEPGSAPIQDCGEGDGARFPGAPEIFGDGIDQDCDGIDLGGACYADLDGDGFGDGDVEVVSALCDGPQESLQAGDCDDTDAGVSPDGTELPGDGLDQDCDGADLCYADLDGDGFGDGAMAGSFGCDDPGESGFDGDCDDAALTVFPGAPELCNGSDDDCDGIDDPGAPTLVFPDLDGDGFGDVDGVAFETCGGAGPTTNTDCDDAQAAVNPDATEVPADGVDQDCDGFELCFVDADLDGFAGDTTTPVADPTCPGFDPAPEDCDDATPQVNPGRPEVCNDVDDDCDGAVDEGQNTQLWFLDGDGDGFGAIGSSVSACQAPGTEWRVVGGDCDDADPDVNPGATEIRADGLDQNCDGRETCHADDDGDGFGTDAVVISEDLACTSAGQSALDSDCDDTAPAVFPGADEVVSNGVDEDCDGEDTLDTGDTGLPGGIDPDTVVWRGGASCTTAPASLGGLGLLGVFALRRRSRGDAAA